MAFQSDGIDTGNRRQFVVQAGVALGAAGWAAAASCPASAAEHEQSPSLISTGDTILFQGDSITDVGRDRENRAANEHSALGNGYAWQAAAAMLVDRPDEKLQIYNRGISGHKVFQLADRWDSDCLQLKPDVLSILIGVNDIWHQLNGKYDGTVEVYERDYRALLERTRAALPECKLVVCEPFVLRCGAVTEEWFPAFDGYRAAARRVAESSGATFVPFQTMFDRAVQLAPPEYWAGDGVHPTPAGAALMAHCWLRTVGGNTA